MVNKIYIYIIAVSGSSLIGVLCIEYNWVTFIYYFVLNWALI